MNTLVKSSSKIKESLVARWKEQEISHADVIRDAIDRGIPMQRKGKGDVNEKVLIQTLSRTLSAKSKAGMNDEQLSWLCIRWSVDIYLTVALLPKHNEKEALKKLKIIFPKTK